MDNILTDWEKLRSFCQKLLQCEEMPEDEAFIASDCLVQADLCGVESHGVSRTGIYLKRLEEKAVNPVCSLKIESEYPASMALNGCNSMGMVTGKRAMEFAIKKAKEAGSSFITVKNSNHYGMAYYYVKMAADENLIGITGTNAPPNIAPWGSSVPYLGTNPIAISAPTEGDPIILDMAPSVVAMGRVIMAARLGQDIPEGWAITKEGEPTTDPNLAVNGSVLPIGGPKGYGISLFIDILSGILSGADYGPHLGNMWNDFSRPQNVGHFFSCIDISKFVSLDVFKKRLGEMRSEIKALPRNEGVGEIFMPGEIELNRVRERKLKGIPLPPVVHTELKDLSLKYNIPFTI